MCKISMVTLFLLVSCSESEIPMKNCPESRAFHYEMEGNAGCMIISQGKLLAVRDKKSGKLGFPAGGGIKSEKATCTAYRETLEETGNPVEVGALLAYFQEGNFFLFRCQLQTPAVTTVPIGVTDEIESIQWVALGNIKPGDWRFAEQFQVIKRIFTNQTQVQSGGK